MLEAQVEQGNEGNSSAFDENICNTRADGGFDWIETVEGFHSWWNALADDNYTLLYEVNPSLRPE